MSATDRLRRIVRDLRENFTEPRYGKHLSVDIDTAEALCDLADAARDYCAGGPLDEWEHAFERMRAALARLDAEASP